MPNIKSAKKRDLIGKARNAQNKVAVKKVDQAVAKGVLHKNAAAHKKSAMTLKLNQVG